MKKLTIEEFVEFVENFLEQPLLEYQKEILKMYFYAGQEGYIVCMPLRHGRTSLPAVFKEYDLYLKGDD